jgi:hypothetical protein
MANSQLSCSSSLPGGHASPLPPGVYRGVYLLLDDRTRAYKRECAKYVLYILHLSYRKTARWIARVCGAVVMVRHGYYQGQEANDKMLACLRDVAPGLYHTQEECDDFGYAPYTFPTLPSSDEIKSGVFNAAGVVASTTSLMAKLTCFAFFRACSFTAVVVPRGTGLCTGAYTVVRDSVAPGLPAPPPVPAVTSIAEAMKKTLKGDCGKALAVCKFVSEVVETVREKVNNHI